MHELQKAQNETTILLQSFTTVFSGQNILDLNR